MIGRDGVNLSLRAALDLRWQRHEALANNLANADTPGFRPSDLEFEGVLQQAVSAQDTVGAAAPERPRETQSLIQRPEVGDTLDDNAVDTDKELARVADNSLHYQTQLELLRRRYAAIQRAITSLNGS